MATIRLVAGSDTPNQGRVDWNNNDTLINDQLENLQTDFDGHRTSSDHDGRYNTKDEVDAKDAVIQTNLNNHKASADHDAAYVKKTGAETIDGEKTFSGNVKISKNNTTALLTLESLGTARNQGRIVHENYGNYHAMMLSLNKSTPESPNWEEVFWAASNDDKIKFQNRDVFARNKKLATEEYVQDRVKTGFYTFQVHGSTLGLAQNTLFEILNSNIGMSFLVAKGSTLRGVSGIIQQGALFQSFAVGCNYIFTQQEIDKWEGYKHIVPFIYAGTSGPGGVNVRFQLKIARIINSGWQVGAEIVDEDEAANSLTLLQPVIVKATIYMSI